MFFMAAARSRKFSNCLGVDLSPTSVALTKSLMGSGHFGRFQDYELRQADFLGAPLPRASFDAIVMGEVLEHVEWPALFMARIRELAAPGAFVFVTTAINAPSISRNTRRRTRGVPLWTTLSAGLIRPATGDFDRFSFRSGRGLAASPMASQTRTHARSRSAFISASGFLGSRTAWYFAIADFLCEQARIGIQRILTPFASARLRRGHNSCL